MREEAKVEINSEWMSLCFGKLKDMVTEWNAYSELVQKRLRAKEVDKTMFAVVKGLLSDCAEHCCNPVPVDGEECLFLISNAEASSSGWQCVVPASPTQIVIGSNWAKMSLTEYTTGRDGDPRMLTYRELDQRARSYIESFWGEVWGYQVTESIGVQEDFSNNQPEPGYIRVIGVDKNGDTQKKVCDQTLNSEAADEWIKQFGEPKDGRESLQFEKIEESLKFKGVHKKSLVESLRQVR